MIRSIPTVKTEDGRPVYGLTLRGIAWIAAEQGVVVAAIVASVLAFVHGDTARQAIIDSRKNGILISCHEANERHKKAIPQVAALSAASTKGKTPAERHAQAEAISGLLHGTKPKTEAGQLALAQTEGFVNIMAPAYLAGNPALPPYERERLGCAQRVRAFSASR